MGYYKIKYIMRNSLRNNYSLDWKKNQDTVPMKWLRDNPEQVEQIALEIINWSLWTKYILEEVK